MLTIEQLIREVQPNRTVLFFGAGSSTPSGVPSGLALRDRIAHDFGIQPKEFTLAEVALLAELKADRARVIRRLRAAIGDHQPSGSLLNLPVYPWKSLYTTNYDELIEGAYTRRRKNLVVYHTNYDFSKEVLPTDQLLFKMHGTIRHDICDGSKSRIIITQADYDKTTDYRENIFDRFTADIAGSHLIVIGQRLEDPDIKLIVDRALSIQAAQYGLAGKISLLLYERDDERASLYESRGIRVCFGGLDEFFAGMAAMAANEHMAPVPADDPLDRFLNLRPATIDARHARDSFEANIGSMFNGHPASYADVNGRLTFDRSIVSGIFDVFSSNKLLCAGIVGASGVGKTTAGRQLAIRLLDEGWWCWEHKSDFRLYPKDWISLAEVLQTRQEFGLLIIDDAHSHLQAFNDLVEGLSSSSLNSLKILYITSKNKWTPRIKSPIIFKMGREYYISKLNGEEVDRLLDLVEVSDVIRPLVEGAFLGFSRSQKRHRLVERCEQDMFVCLKNIFSTEKFDDIILREFNDLEEHLQQIYRVVSAMESSGIRVHRQLIIRLLGIPAKGISSVLDQLEDIVIEYDISRASGVFGWRIRHTVIADIVTKYKFYDVEEFISLFDRVIGSLSPSYEIERRTISEICNFDTGISRIPDYNVQNRLLRRLISIAPGERVPRHRLIRNLIEADQFDLAETEIKIFINDLGRDSPVARYQVALLLARAMHTKGIANEDRLVILDQARILAIRVQERYPLNRGLFGIYCDIGLQIFRISAKREIFDEALEKLKRAELRLADPEITKMIRRYEKLIISARPSLDATGGV